MPPTMMAIELPVLRTWRGGTRKKRIQGLGSSFKERGSEGLRV